MENKKIFVIDDEGDVLNFVLEAFKDNSKIEIFDSKSDFDELNRKFKRNFSLILINKDNIKNDLRLLTNFIKKHFFYLIIPVLVLTSDEEYIKNQNMFYFPILN